MAVQLRNSVGMRWRSQNVTNNSDDQEKVVALLSNISTLSGGMKEVWSQMPPLMGGNGCCTTQVVDAIWSFQEFWKAFGGVNVVDGVVDPNGRSLKKMNELTTHVSPSPKPAGGSNGPILPPVIIPHSSWKITNVTTASIGEVGMAGKAELQVMQPDGRKFTMHGWGTGFGGGIDPASWLKMLKGINDPLVAITLRQFGEMMFKGVGFSLGDYLQLLGVNLSNVTRGTIIPNPLNRYLGRPTVVSRYMLAGGVRPPFAIASAGGGLLAGGEVGIVLFGPPIAGIIFCDALGFYGNYGVTLKAGIGTGWLLYHCSSVSDD